MRLKLQVMSDEYTMEIPKLVWGKEVEDRRPWLMRRWSWFPSLIALLPTVPLLVASGLAWHRLFLWCTLIPWIFHRLYAHYYTIHGLRCEGCRSRFAGIECDHDPDYARKCLCNEVVPLDDPGGKVDGGWLHAKCRHRMALTALTNNGFPFKSMTIEGARFHDNQMVVDHYKVKI